MNIFNKLFNKRYNNSGDEIEKIREFIERDKFNKQLEIEDFSDFPKFGEKINELLLDNIEPISFNNKSVMFYSKKEIEKIGFKSILQLRKLYVNYDIVTDLGKHYFGITQDYGERINTHDKDGRSDVKSLYCDIRKYGRALIRPLNVCNSEYEAKKYEKIYVTEYIKRMISMHYPNIIIRDLDYSQLKGIANHFCYNTALVKNIIN